MLHNAKTLQRTHHRIAITLRKQFRGPSNQDALHLLLLRAADLGLYQDAKRLWSCEHVLRRNPSRWTRGGEAAFAKPNGLIMLPVWLPCWLKHWRKPPRYNFTELSLIIRLATDPVQQHKSTDVSHVGGVWAGGMCICVIITFVHPSVNSN